MDSNPSVPQFTSRKKVIVLIDLAGTTRAFQSEGDVKMAIVLQQYYTDCERVVSSRGGTVIKFIGDACLAVFPEDQAKNAVDAVSELQSAVDSLARREKVPIEVGANLHMAFAIEGDFGAGANRRHDILGRGVNQTFLLGRGAGIRISEPVYRALPSAARSPWIRHKPPAVYHLDKTEGIYEG